MEWKVGDRAVVKGNEVIIEPVISSFEYCKRCNICIDCGQLAGAIWRSGFTEDIQDVYCFNCLQPADREEKVRKLIEVAKLTYRIFSAGGSHAQRHGQLIALVKALSDLGEEV